MNDYTLDSRLDCSDDLFEPFLREFTPPNRVESFGKVMLRVVAKFGDSLDQHAAR